MPTHRNRGRPKGAVQYHPSIDYAVYRALRDYSPEKLPGEIARLAGAALYVPPMAHPHDKWIQAEFTLTRRKEPFRTTMLASGEAMARAVIERQAGPVVSWRTRPCDPPERPKPKKAGSSAEAIAKRVRRLIAKVEGE
jgi:hypothetical protein